MTLAPRTLVNSEGFITTVLPATIAALVIPMRIATGKFQGAMVTPTPIGW
jgi:hypothetical protein